MRRVLVESPYAGNLLQRWLNRRYARRCLHDCLKRGEAPFASHLLYTQPGVLRDGVKLERELGIRVGLVWGEWAEATVVYIDRGISAGMLRGIEHAEKIGRPIERRSLTPGGRLRNLRWLVAPLRALRNSHGMRTSAL